MVFNEIMDNLSDVDMALGMYYAAGVSISPGKTINYTIITIIYYNSCIAELKLTCEAVIQTKINDHLLDVLFTLFDDNSTWATPPPPLVIVPYQTSRQHALVHVHACKILDLIHIICTCIYSLYLY